MPEVASYHHRKAYPWHSRRLFLCFLSHHHHLNPSLPSTVKNIRKEHDVHIFFIIKRLKKWCMCLKEISRYLFIKCIWTRTRKRKRKWTFTNSLLEKQQPLGQTWIGSKPKTMVAYIHYKLASIMYSIMLSSNSFWTYSEES